MRSKYTSDELGLKICPFKLKWYQKILQKLHIKDYFIELKPVSIEILTEEDYQKELLTIPPKYDKDYQEKLKDDLYNAVINMKE